MPKLSSILAALKDSDKRSEFMCDLFDTLKKEVDAILLFGSCNNIKTTEASNAYYYRKRNKPTAFSCYYTQSELMHLPPVIANEIRLTECSNYQIKIPRERYSDYLKMAYLYGTGTCEFFAIVGAYVLSQRYEINLSIETIYSEESHTYIRVHGVQEYILDFWGGMVCDYSDDITWNEFFGMLYARNNKSSIKNEISLNERDLRTLGEEVFTNAHLQKREQVIAKVQERVQQERRASSAERPVVGLSLPVKAQS